MSERIDSTREQTPDDLQRLSAPSPVFQPGDTVPGLNSWVLHRKLGSGGFGEVWLARHAWNAKEGPRAVKFCLDPAARTRLVTHERNVVVRVMKYAGDHPNIVPLLDCNLDGDIPWLMYEFVDGGTLAGLVKEWRELPLTKRLSRAVRVLHALAGALATCHRFDPPLVHRDMKPQNVLMAGSVPRITDFGIGGVVPRAPADGTKSEHTSYAARVPTDLHGSGTRLYAPAEQTLGSTPDPRDDVYALGIIAYQLLTTDLTTGPGADASLELRDLRVPGELAALIIRSAALDPARRPTDATEWEATLADLIRRAQKHSAPSDSSITGSKPVLITEPDPPTTAKPSARTAPQPAPPPVPLELPPEPLPERAAPVRRNSRRLLALALGGTILVLIVAVVIALRPSGKPTQPPDQPKGGEPVPKAGGPKGSAPEPKVTPPNPKGGSGSPKAGDTREVEIAKGVTMTFCWVPAGACQLGSPKAEQDYITTTFFNGERPSWLDDETEAARRTFKTDGFWMGKYEVTQAEWRAVMGANPSYLNGTNDNEARGLETGRFPVENVTWNDICGAGGFLAKLNARGKPGRFALPHEDAWEYACRGGSDDRRPFHFGATLNGTEANVNGNLPYGAAKGAYLDRTCAVDFTNDGKYAKHPWGLMHMHGNVWEWCENLYGDGRERVLRGGSWSDPARSSRSAYRCGECAPDFTDKRIGFRLVIRLE